MKHALTRTTKKDKITNLTTFDIETIKWTKPYAVGYYDGKEYKSFEGQHAVKNFIEFFLSYKNRGKICYAHNGGKFDFSFLLNELNKINKKHFQTKIIRIGASIVELKIQSVYKNKIHDTWIFRDSLKLIMNSLKNITENFDVEHKKGEFDHKKINWKNWDQLKKEWSPYLKSDCVGLYESLRKFENYIYKRFDTTLNKNLTIAQLSMSIFRKKFLKTSINTYKKYEDDIRNAYYGGRTEIFKQFGKNLKYYDVNSLYPSVMKKYSMPVGIPIKSYSMTLNDFGIIKAEVKAPENIEIPILPYKEENTGKLIFPKGEWTGYFTTEELKKAKKLGYEIKIIYGYKFRKEKIFTEFVNNLQEIKVKAKKGSIDYVTSKLIQNSLYGKFGQRRERTKLTMCPTNVLGMKKISEKKGIEIFSIDDLSESNHILPAIACFVTSYARLELYKLFEEIKEKEGTVYYCDTDSVITDVELNTGDYLGELSDELDGKTIQEGIFFLPKMYAYKLNNGVECVRCKGFPRTKTINGKKVNFFKYSDFEKALFENDLNNFNYKNRKFASPFESLRRNKCFYSMIDFKRSIVTKYDKRIVLEDFSTIPKIINVTKT